MTAAATTGPNKQPRPTSSTPATSFAPADHARFSNFCVHFSRLSRRILAAAAESTFSTPSGVITVTRFAVDVLADTLDQRRFAALNASLNENGPDAIRDCVEAVWKTLNPSQRAKPVRLPSGAPACPSAHADRRDARDVLHWSAALPRDR